MWPGLPGMVLISNIGRALWALINYGEGGIHICVMHLLLQTWCVALNLLLIIYMLELQVHIIGCSGQSMLVVLVLTQLSNNTNLFQS